MRQPRAMLCRVQIHLAERNLRFGAEFITMRIEKPLHFSIGRHRLIHHVLDHEAQLLRYPPADNFVIPIQAQCHALSVFHFGLNFLFRQAAKFVLRWWPRMGLDEDFHRAVHLAPFLGAARVSPQS